MATEFSADGVELYGFEGSWIPPGPDGAHQVRVLAHNVTADTWHDLTGPVPASDGGFVTDKWPKPATPQTFDLYCLAISRDGHENTLVEGVTPKVAGLTVAPSATGGLKANRIDPDTLHGSLTNALGQLAIAAKGVTTDKLADLAVTAAQLADGTISNAKLADLAVDAAKLANSAVTSTKIANLAVGTAAIADAAITSLKIGSAAVGSAAIAALAVGTAHIADAAVTDAKIYSLAVSKLTAGTISAAISITSPTIVATGSGFVARMDSTYGLKVDNTANQSSAVLTSGALEVKGTGGNSNYICNYSYNGITMGYVGAGGVTIYNASNPSMYLSASNGSTVFSVVASPTNTVLALQGVSMLSAAGLVAPIPYYTSDPSASLSSGQMAYWWDGATMWLVFKQGANRFRWPGASY